jgi:hypothetical protein
MTRHEPAGLSKAAIAETITGSSEPSGGRACLRGLRPLTCGALVPRLTSLGAQRGLAYRSLASAPLAATDFGC